MQDVILDTRFYRSEGLITLLIELQNDSSKALVDIVVEVSAPDSLLNLRPRIELGDLEPGGTIRCAAPFSPVLPGMTAIRGRVVFIKGGKRRAIMIPPHMLEVGIPIYAGYEGGSEHDESEDVGAEDGDGPLPPDLWDLRIL